MEFDFSGLIVLYAILLILGTFEVIKYQQKNLPPDPELPVDESH
ncbi:hypothetical protein [Desulfovibrio inopinatus]|nr:hypothetical protein [Desulfovibrio inopinatus]